jgi:hypothetical protein
MTITNRMKTCRTEHIYTNPDKIAEEIANGTFKVSRDVCLDKTEELAAHLACWVAGEADEFVDSEDKDTWPLIATMAELAAMAMLIQHDATCARNVHLREVPQIDIVCDLVGLVAKFIRLDRNNKNCQPLLARIAELVAMGMAEQDAVTTREYERSEGSAA